MNHPAELLGLASLFVPRDIVGQILDKLICCFLRCQGLVFHIVNQLTEIVIKGTELPEGKLRQVNHPAELLGLASLFVPRDIVGQILDKLICCFLRCQGLVFHIVNQLTEIVIKGTELPEMLNGYYVF